MARTTGTLVAGIIEIDPTFDLAVDLDPFIFPANELVTEACGNYGHSAGRLEIIERYLSAHFYTLRDPRPVSERAGSVSATYQSKVDLNLSTSHYGQTAMVLDTSGGLADLNNQAIRGKRTVSLTWGGTAADAVR